MGYASLNFPTNGSMLITTALHDIVGCVTGIFSASAQLKGANTASSVIENSLGQNWNFAYPASSSFVPNTPNNTLASWVLTAPCVNTGKTKFIRLTNFYRMYAGSPAVNTTGVVDQNTYSVALTNSAWAGVLLQACTSASSASSLVNPSWYNTSANTGLFTTNNFAGSNIIISWSHRHIILWSNGSSNSTGVPMLSGYVEFPETEVTTAQGIIPAALLIERNGSLASTLGAYAPSGLDSVTGLLGDIQFPDFYSVSTSTRSTLTYNGTFGTLDSLSNQWSRPFNTIPTINSLGQNTLMLIPLIINHFGRGVSYMYMSTLSNLYIVANGLGTGGDTISIGSDTYVYLPSQTGMSFAIKKV